MTDCQPTTFIQN